MRGQAVRWSLAAVAAASVTLGVFLARDPLPVPVSTDQPQSRASQPTARSGTTTRASIYQEVVAARRQAVLEALAVAPEPGRRQSPVAPGSDKGAQKRESLVTMLTATLLSDIATAHGLTVEELDEIFREGQTKRWPLP